MRPGPRRSRHVFLTLAKELREALREPRTLAVMLLLPLVIYPLLALGLGQVIGAREKARATRPARVHVAGQGPAASEARALIGRHAKALSLAPRGGRADVEAGTLDALIDVADGAAAPPWKLALVYDASRDESRQAAERVAEMLAASLPDGCAARFRVERRSLATDVNLGGYVLSKALPMVIVLMVLLGAFYPALDVTAGERERGTIETVLAAPVRRFDLLLAKVLAVTVLASLTGLLNLASMSVTLIHTVRLAAPDAALPVPWARAAAACAVVVPSAFLFASVFVAAGSLARGIKDAHGLLMPLHLLLVAPALVGSAGDYVLDGSVALVPSLNVTLLARELVTGRATLDGALVALGSTVLYGCMALAFAARVYDSERFLDPVGARAAPGATGRAGPPAADAVPPSAGEALLVFAIGFLLFAFVFVPWQTADLVSGLLAGQWLGLVGLAALYARATGRKFVPLVRLATPSAGALGGAALIGASAWAGVSVVTQWIAPAPKEVIEELRRLFVPEVGGRGLLANLLLVALTPAVCEEIFFRGIVLRGLATRLAPGAAAVATGVLFAIFHLDVWRLLPATVLGTLLSLVALRTGSLVPSMLCHFMNNAILVLAVSAGADRGAENLGAPVGVAVLMASAAVVFVGLRLVRRGNLGASRA